VGNAVATGAGSLPFKKIVHTVGPMWLDGSKRNYEKPVQLRKAVANAIEVTGIMGYRSVAMPAISSGIFGFPKDLCATCLIDEAVRYAELREKLGTKGPQKLVSDIRFTNFDNITCAYFMADFDRRKFDAEGRQNWINDVTDEWANEMLSKDLRVDVLREGDGDFIP